MAAAQIEAVPALSWLKARGARVRREPAAAQAIITLAFLETKIALSREGMLAKGLF